MIMLAQLETVPSETVKNFALIILAILGGAYYVKELMGGAKKREVSFGFEPANKVEVQNQIGTLRTEDEKLHARIGGVERGLRNEFAGEIKMVRAEMIEAAKQLSGLSKSAELFNQSLAEQRSRLDREIERQ